MALRRFSTEWWMALFHFRTAPRKAFFIESGYMRAKEWGGGKRDICLTAALVLTLIFIAIFIGGPLTDLRLVHVKTSVCVSPGTKLEQSLNTIRRMTNYTEGVNATNEAVSRMSDAFTNATLQYEPFGGNSTAAEVTWPEPYEPSEEDKEALEAAANKQCPQADVCVEFLGIEIKCESLPDIPCPDVEATEKLAAMSEAQEAFDIYGNANPTTIVNVTTSAADNFLDSVVGPLQDLVARINVAAMVYVIWLAVVLVFAPPVYRVYGASHMQDCRQVLVSVNKPMWIAIVVLLWYIYGAIVEILRQSEFKVVWSNFNNDPCWVDGDYLADSINLIGETCANISSNSNLYYQAIYNYQYHDAVEGTWLAAIDDVAAVYNSTLAASLENNTFPSSCNENDLFLAIEPAEAEVDWFSVVYNAGTIVGVMLQVALAQWFLAWFSLLHPLIRNRGTLLTPQGTEVHHYSVLSDAKSFVRTASIFPCIAWFLLLVFLMINLADSTASTLTAGEVGMTAGALTLWSFFVLPLLVFYKRAPVEAIVMQVELDERKAASATELRRRIQQQTDALGGTFVNQLVLRGRRAGATVKSLSVRIGFDDYHTANKFGVAVSGSGAAADALELISMVDPSEEKVTVQPGPSS